MDIDIYNLVRANDAVAKSSLNYQKYLSVQIVCERKLKKEKQKTSSALPRTTLKQPQDILICLLTRCLWWRRGSPSDIQTLKSVRQPGSPTTHPETE